MLAQKHPHPYDSTIHFHEESHTYRIDGVAEPPISVSSLYGKFFPKFNGPEVVDRYYSKWQMNPSSPYYGKSKEEILDGWKRNGEEASLEGKELHKKIEDYLNGDLKEVPQSIEFGYFMNFVKTLNPTYRWYRTEWSIRNTKGTACGMIDATIMTPEGEIIIVDWKRSKEMKFGNDFGKSAFGPLKGLPDCNFAKYTVQQNCYRHFLVNDYHMKVKAMYLVVLHPDYPDFLILEVPLITEMVDQLMKTV